MALAGHLSRTMMERYSYIRMEAKRRAVDDLSGVEFELGWAQNRAQFFGRYGIGDLICPIFTFQPILWPTDTVYGCAPACG
jgi:hypothetical protein